MLHDKLFLWETILKNIVHCWIFKRILIPKKHSSGSSMSRTTVNVLQKFTGKYQRLFYLSIKYYSGSI